MIFIIHIKLKKCKQCNDWILKKHYHDGSLSECVLKTRKKFSNDRCMC